MTPRGYVHIEKLADDLFTRSGSPRKSNGWAVDVEAILQIHFSFDVAFIPRLTLGGNRLSGAYIPARKIVMIEAMDSWQRKRFTMAHETGHAELDFQSFANGPAMFELNEPVVYRCPPDRVDDVPQEKPKGDRSEVLANKFAACLLMPSRLVRDAWIHTHNLEQCANLLEVSRESLGYRLKDLRIIDLGQLQGSDNWLDTLGGEST